MHDFSTLFDKDLYMFRTDVLSIINGVNTVSTVDCIAYCINNYVPTSLTQAAKHEHLRRT